MKLALNMLIFSASFIVLAAVVLAFYNQSGQAPGLNNRQLAACPSKPNCICSDHPQNASHYITPLAFSTKQQKHGMTAIKTSITELGGQINSEQGYYIASTFSSKLFGFIDDVEIRLDLKQNQIHLRSASRIGYSDLGVNRKRAMALKKAIQHHLDSMTGSSA